MTVPVADQRRLIHILADDLQPRIDWAYNLEQELLAIGAGFITFGNGDPNGLVTAEKGDLRIDVTTPAVWQNQNGGTVWTNISAGGGSGLPDPWTANQTSGEVVARTNDATKTPITIEAIAAQVAALLVLTDENGATVESTNQNGTGRSLLGNVGLGADSPWGDPAARVLYSFDAAGSPTGAWMSLAFNADPLNTYAEMVQSVLADLSSYTLTRTGKTGSIYLQFRQVGAHTAGTFQASADGTGLPYHAHATQSDQTVECGFWCEADGNPVAGVIVTDTWAKLEAGILIGQTEPPFAVHDIASGKDLARVLVSGAIGTSAGEPADADINPGECFEYFDPTNGAARTCRKAKTLDGTVVIGFGPMAP